MYQHLFTDRDHDLYEKNGDWQEQRKTLDMRRETAISEILQHGGADGVVRFSEYVSSPGRVGYALGIVGDGQLDRVLLPRFLDSSDNRHKALASGFIWRRYHINGWDWCDDTDKSDWTPAQVGQFLAWLPFAKEAWDRVPLWLHEHESEYWTRTDANAHHADGDFAIAIDKLIEHGRPHAAIDCLTSMRYANQPINVGQCVRALLSALSSKEPSWAMHGYHIVQLIQFLQAEHSVNKDDLFKVEWAYLPLLDGQGGAAPRLLETKLAKDPDFFSEVIRLVYRSKKEDRSPRKPDEDSEAIAANAWRLLHQWKTPPGAQEDGTFSDEHFGEWLRRTKEVCAESGHLETALSSIGEVLVYAPPDPHGLWIRRVVAAALNDREADEMRNGFEVGTYNSRGTHLVDPTGNPERKLAALFRSKAEQVENVGFQRFAVTLRGLAAQYDREASRVIRDNRDLDED